MPSAHREPPCLHRFAETQHLQWTPTFRYVKFLEGRENVDLVFLVDHSLILKLQCVNVKKCNCFLCRNLQILLILINTPVRECVVFGRWISLTDPWQINFRDILLIIISRGTNNCPTCIWEKHFIMIPPPPPSQLKFLLSNERLD